jgi:hypothetical protein
MSGILTLRGELGARIIWYSVCGPFVAWGDWGEKSTPSVGWEVPMRSNQLVSRSWMEHIRDNDFESFKFGYGTHVYIGIEW